MPQPREQRRVWFADGILPNGEVADAAKLTMNGTSSAGTLAVSHDPVKPVATSPLPTEVRIGGQLIVTTTLLSMVLSSVLC